MSARASASPEGWNLTGAVTPRYRSSTHADLLCMKDNSVHQHCEIILDGRITFGVPCFTYSKHAAVVLQHAPTVRVGGPAYVHTCVLSGSGGTARVLAHSLNTIFKPLCGSFSFCSSASETCCIAALCCSCLDIAQIVLFISLLSMK